MTYGLPPRCFVGVRSILIAALAASGAAPTALAEGPVLKDFVGLNGHTVLFDEDVYAPVASLVRDYHNLSWDIGSDGSKPTLFPMSQNGVNWDTLYGSWVDAGFRINAAIQFGGENGDLGDGDWANMAADARRYGEALGTHFGANGLLNSVQIGNEPGGLSDANYRLIFQNMAEGIRATAPQIKIVTCNMNLLPSGSYSKNVNVLAGLEHLIDVYAIHSYPEVTPWDNWRRSYPEDPAIQYLTNVQDLIDWRDSGPDPTAEVWITEFGYDATAPGTPNHTSGTWKDWEGNVTEQQQAQYLTRSFLIFSRMGLDRAYMFWFNDNNSPTNHGASGLTRNGVPKPSYYAMQHLQETLGEFRFDEVIQEDQGDAYIYAFEHGEEEGELIWVLWSATGGGSEIELTLTDLPGELLWAEMMPQSLADVQGVPVDYELLSPTSIRLTVGESPIYLRFAASPVPEPTALMLLGAGGLALLRRGF